MSGESLDDLTLADVSALGDPDELRARAEAVLRADGPEPRPAKYYEGTDDSGAVMVVVDSMGRVSDLVIRPTWTDQLGAERLAGGVYGAYVAAVQKAMTIERALREERPASAESSDVEDGGWPTVPGPGEADFDTWLAAVSATNAEANARLSRLAAPEPPPPDEEFRSPSGFLTLRVRAGSLAGVDGNPDGMRWSDADALRRDALAVFREAGLAEPQHGPRDDDESNEDLGVFDY